MWKDGGLELINAKTYVSSYEPLTSQRADSCQYQAPLSDIPNIRYPPAVKIAESQSQRNRFKDQLTERDSGRAFGWLTERQLPIGPKTIGPKPIVADPIGSIYSPSQITLSLELAGAANVANLPCQMASSVPRVTFRGVSRNADLNDP